MTRLVANPLLPFWPAALAALLAGMVAAWLHLRRRRLYPPRWSAALLALRLAAVALLGCILLGPALEVTTEETEHAGLVIALDASRSMSLPAAGAASRWSAARSFLKRHAATIRRLAPDGRVRAVLIGGDPVPAPDALPAPDAVPTPDALPDAPTFEATNLATIADLPAGTGGKTRTVLLLSDGGHNTDTDPEEAARELARRGGRLMVLAVGAGAALGGDVAVRLASPPRKAFVGAPVEVNCQVAIRGHEGGAVQIVFLVDGTESGRHAVTATGPLFTTRQSFSFIPRATGPHRLEVRAEPLAGEANVDNNIDFAFLEVHANRVRVLILERELRWETRFLRRALARATNLDVELRHGVGGAPGGLGDPLPDTADGWLAFQAVILGDVSAADVEEKTLAALREAVGKGLGCILTGGLHALGEGDMGRSQLAPALPVQLPAGEVTGGFRVALTGDPLARDIFGMADAEMVAGLPEVAGANLLAEPGPGASVLARTSGTNQPLLVAGRHGDGRVVVVAMDGTWRWAMAGEAASAFHEQFWRGLVAWATQMQTHGRKPVLLVETEKAACNLGQTALVTIRPWPPGTTDMGEVTVTTGPEGGDRRTFTLPASGGGQVRVRCDAPGPWLVTASAGDRAEPGQARFMVRQASPETVPAPPDTALLRRMAAGAGGDFALLEEAGEDFWNQLSLAMTPRTWTRRRVRTIRDGWLLPVALLLALTCDWAVRRHLELAGKRGDADKTATG